MHACKSTRLSGLWSVIASCGASAFLTSAPALGQSCAQIFPGPTWTATPSWNGYAILTLSGDRSIAEGAAVAYANLYENGVDLGVRVVRLTSAGWTDHGPGYVQAINAGGVSTGWIYTRTTGGYGGGSRAVRWSPTGTVTQLNTISTSSFGFANNTARDINTAGTVVGGGSFYNFSFQDRGKRAIRWNAGSTLATTLGSIGTDATGSTYSEAAAINDAGVAVGYAQKWGPSIPPGGDDGGGTGYNGDRGQRAVRWAAGSTVAVELGHLGENLSNYTNCNANHINAGGTIIGWANKYSANRQVWLGRRVVRWNPDSTQALELPVLSTDPAGFALADAWDLSDSGIIAGRVPYHSAAGTLLGERAVTWDAATGSMTVLPHLWTDASGHADSAAYAVNNAGVVVGRAEAFDAAGTLIGWRAVMWAPDGTPTDLSSFFSPSSGWVSLDFASGITDGMWISGVGRFDADGAGPAQPYSRIFLLNLSNPRDYNRDGSVNLDDVSDLITDYYTVPAIPGGHQPAAPAYPDSAIGFGVPCTDFAPDAPFPYSANAYRQFGYRVAFSLDGSNACPASPDQSFPSLDNLSEFITHYYAGFSAGGC
jgi:hypothetical protein